MPRLDLDPKKALTILYCDYCNYKFKNKELLANHIRIHTDNQKYSFKCNVCKLAFKNKGLLFCHKSRAHRLDEKLVSKNNPKLKFRCDGCHVNFKNNYQLKYHIRKTHYNLVTSVPHRDFRINQVWFEKVLNTNIIVEIQKINNNQILIRKLGENTTVKPTELKKDVIDLRLLYPTGQCMQRVKCHICTKFCRLKSLKKHLQEIHNILN